MAEGIFRGKDLYDILVEKSDIKKSEKFILLEYIFITEVIWIEQSLFSQAISCNPVRFDLITNSTGFVKQPQK